MATKMVKEMKKGTRKAMIKEMKKGMGEKSGSDEVERCG